MPKYNDNFPQKLNEYCITNNIDELKKLFQNKFALFNTENSTEKNYKNSINNFCQQHIYIINTDLADTMIKSVSQAINFNHHEIVEFLLSQPLYKNLSQAMTTSLYKKTNFYPEYLLSQVINQDNMTVYDLLIKNNIFSNKQELKKCLEEHLSKRDSKPTTTFFKAFKHCLTVMENENEQKLFITNFFSKSLYYNKKENLKYFYTNNLQKQLNRVELKDLLHTILYFNHDYAHQYEEENLIEMYHKVSPIFPMEKIIKSHGVSNVRHQKIFLKAMLEEKIEQLNDSAPAMSTNKKTKI
jgi:hypothetical protein